MQPSSASEDFDPTPQASRQGEGSGRLEHPPLARKDSCLAPRVSKKKKGSRQKVAGARTEDFIPWVPPISRHSQDREEEEEEEDDMSGLVHNFASWKRKRDGSLKQATDVALEVAGRSG